MDRKTFRKEVTFPAMGHARVHLATRVGDHVFTNLGGWVNRHSLYRSTIATMLNMAPRYRAMGDKEMVHKLLDHARKAIEYHRAYAKRVMKV